MQAARHWELRFTHGFRHFSPFLFIHPPQQNRAGNEKNRNGLNAVTRITSEAADAAHQDRPENRGKFAEHVIKTIKLRGFVLRNEARIK